MVLYWTFVHSQSYDQLRRQKCECFRFILQVRVLHVVQCLLVESLINELVWQQLELAIDIVNVACTQVLVNDVGFTHEGECVQDILDHLFHVFGWEQPVGVQSAFDQLLQSGLRILQEEQGSLVRQFHTVGERSRSNSQNSLMFQPGDRLVVAPGLCIHVSARGMNLARLWLLLTHPNGYFDYVNNNFLGYQLIPLCFP